jgi:hypothetical protein
VIDKTTMNPSSRPNHKIRWIISLVITLRNYSPSFLNRFFTSLK